MVSEADPPLYADVHADEVPVEPTGMAAVLLRLREVIEFGSYYVAAQVDRFKLTAINLAMFAVLGVMAAVIGVAVVFTAAVLLVVGIAHGFGELFAALLGPRFYWLGDLVTAGVILGVMFGGVIVGLKIVTKMTRKGLVAAYEQRKSQQRETLGTDVETEFHPRR